jgi:hypothetical protein
VKFVGEVDHEDTSTLYVHHDAVRLVSCGGLLGDMQTGIIIFVRCNCKDANCITEIV